MAATSLKSFTVLLVVFCSIARWWRKKMRLTKPMIDEASSRLNVIPAKAGIQVISRFFLDARLRGHDDPVLERCRFRDVLVLLGCIVTVAIFAAPAHGSSHEYYG